MIPPPQPKCKALGFGQICKCSHINTFINFDLWTVSDSYLVELHTREDFNAFQAFLFNLMDQFGKSSGYVATGAEIVQFTNNTVGIVWGHSKAPIDVDEDGLFKPFLGYYWDVKIGNNLMLQPVNFKPGTYLAGNPTFYLKPWLYPDGSFEFACMRDGK